MPFKLFQCCTIEYAPENDPNRNPRRILKADLCSEDSQGLEKSGYESSYLTASTDTAEQRMFSTRLLL